MFSYSVPRQKKMNADAEKLLLSVIIITRNRPEKLFHTLQTLDNNTFTHFEVVVVDQSDAEVPHLRLNQLSKKFARFKMVHSQQKGKSKGLNLALQLVQASLIAFTDDDCILDQQWLSSIYTTFVDKPNVSAIFGRTLPYQPEKHRGDICPATFENQNSAARLISTALTHWDCGYGNNMAFRKKVFEELGGFKEWLGPGSIGSNSEDAEITFRTLIAKKRIFYSPKMVVYHDRWLTKRENYIQDCSYMCGEMAGYGYYALTGNVTAKQVIKNKLRDACWYEPIDILKSIIHPERDTPVPLFWWAAKLVAQCRGAVIGISFFFWENIFTKSISKVRLISAES